MLLDRIDNDIWIYEGSVVQFFQLPFTTRMTVIRLRDNRLWIHSPEKLNPDLQAELKYLGEVTYLVSPNKLHHLFLNEWVSAYPNADVFAAPGPPKKRKDIHFTKVLGNSAEPEWADDIHQVLFQGSPIMEEVVFFHIKSGTLILTDLIENFDPQYFTGWRKVAARLSGVLSPNGRTPLDWRLSFLCGKAKARKSLNTIVRWNPENIIIAHGKCIMGNGTSFLKKSFSWI